MKNWNNVIKHTTFRYIDHTNQTTFNNEPFTAMSSFAIDDALALSVSNKASAPTLRLWAHDKSVILGIPDARLPYLDQGVEYLRKNDYDVIIRNSGGLAVALDSGVINLSLILPDAKLLSIHDSYEAMYSFIQFTLRDLTTNIKAYEIVGSYCPGDYDLSIDGVKFAGISQRRVRDGVAIQIYLDVSGNYRERGDMIRHFYNISLQNKETAFTYPTIQPEKMSSLSALLGISLTVNDMKKRIYQSIEHLSEQIMTQQPFSQTELEDYKKRYDQMIKRNEKINVKDV